VIAKDNDYLHSDRVTIIIELIDINDNTPIIELIQFHAQDFDAPNTSNSFITYSLILSNNSRFFQLDPITGILSVEKNISFDYEYQSKYDLILNILFH
ncbi:unnamed protein product, partial [Rotaria sp. Silwood1]